MIQAGYKFSNLTIGTFESAQKITSLIVELIGLPKRIVDLGGGGGGWLKAFEDLGTEQVYCIDHPSVKEEDLLISINNFIPCDLSKEMPSPIKCDLAISTEFAEHINKSRSEAIVDFLTQSSSFVLFSAATPGQGGLGHVNEQHTTFWRNLYEEKGYQLLDVVRPKIIFDKTIPFWFRQNLYLYVDKNALKKMPLSSTNLFLPDDFEIVYRPLLETPGLRTIFTTLRREFLPALSRRVGQRFNSSKNHFIL